MKLPHFASFIAGLVLFSCTTDLQVLPEEGESFFLNGILSKNGISLVEVGNLDRRNLTDFNKICDSETVVELTETSINNQTLLLLNDSCKYEGSLAEKGSTFDLRLMYGNYLFRSQAIELPTAINPTSTTYTITKKNETTNTKSFQLSIGIDYEGQVPPNIYSAIAIMRVDTINTDLTTFLESSGPQIDFPFNSRLVNGELNKNLRIVANTSFSLKKEIKKIKTKIIIYYLNEASYKYAEKLYKQSISLLDPFAIPVVVQGNVVGAYGFVFGVSQYEEIYEIELPE